MNNPILYSEGFKALKWNDFNFKTIQINTLSALKDPRHYNNCFIFRDSLIKAVEEVSRKKVFKLLFITPDYKTVYKFYIIAYLEGKIVFPLTIENTPLFKEWFTAIDDEKDKDFISTIYNFSHSSYSSQPITNLEHMTFHENTGDFINQFIPNEFIAEQLAKEKADFLNPYIQLKAQINIEEVKQTFETLIKAKGLTINSPTNNDATYDTFEKEAGFPFPQIIKAYLSLHNGIDRCAIMGAETIYKEWKQWKAIYDDWTQEELLDTYATNQGKALLMYTTPYWIPFFDLSNGNFLAFDFAPNTKGTAGQIIRYGADQEIGYIHADNLHTFLKSLLNNEGEIEDHEWFYTAQ